MPRKKASPTAHKAPKTPLEVLQKIEQEEQITEEQRPGLQEKNKQVKQAHVITAQDLLEKSMAELASQEIKAGKREAHNLLQDLKIITAILLGKKKNKELAQVLNTDKSFTSKQVKELEQKGLVRREGSGKETSYEVDQFNVMEFLQSRIVIKWSKKESSDKTRAEKSSTRPGKTTSFAREEGKPKKTNPLGERDG